MIDERGNDWRRDPPEGTEMYVWFMPDDRASDEPDVVYIGLLDEHGRGAWFGKDATPIPLRSLSGRFLHPAVQIPYCNPTDEAIKAAEAREARMEREWQRVNDSLRSRAALWFSGLTKLAVVRNQRVP